MKGRERRLRLASASLEACIVEASTILSRLILHLVTVRARLEMAEERHDEALRDIAIRSETPASLRAWRSARGELEEMIAIHASYVDLTDRFRETVRALVAESRTARKLA